MVQGLVAPGMLVQVPLTAGAACRTSAGSFQLRTMPLPADYCTKRYNFRVPEMVLVTVFWPLTTTGAGEFVIQPAGESRFVVDCKVNPVALVGHFTITFAP